MKRKFLTVLLTLMATLCLFFAFTACDNGSTGSGDRDAAGNNSAEEDLPSGGNGSGHTHQFATAWSFDDMTHWHEATCGHSVKQGETSHTYVNGVCTACGHAHELHSYGAYSMTESGHSRVCAVCQKVETGTHTYANGSCTACEYAHTLHTYGSYTSNDSTHTRTCSVCHTVETAAHTYVGGVCTTCGHAHEGHSYAAYTADEGGHSHTCTVCHKTESAGHVYANGVCAICEYAHVDHSFGSYTSNNNQHIHTCAVCHKSVSSDHTWDNGSVELDATTDVPGYKVFTCIACGFQRYDEIPVLPHDHNFSQSWTRDDEFHWHTCDACSTVSGKEAHDWDEGKLVSQSSPTEDAVKLFTCQTCGMTKTDTVPGSSIPNTLTFTLAPSAAYYTVSRFEGDASEIKIPNTHNGLRVNGIDEGAFRDNLILQKVTLPNTIETIGNSAFEGCTALTQINLPESVRTIGDAAFRNCTQLSSPTFATKIDGEPHSGLQIGAQAFFGCTSLVTVEFADNTQKIGSMAFAGCSALQRVIFNASLKEIEDNAFAACRILSQADLPASLTTIGDFAFDNCALLRAEFPAALTKLGTGAFRDNRQLGTLVFADGLEEIPAVCFQNCSSLESVDIPKRITAIGSSAFSCCFGLKELFLRGASYFGPSAFYRAENLTSLYYNGSAHATLDNENYVFYRAGLNIEDGICLTIGPSGYIPQGLFEAIHHQDAPNITSIVIEEGGSAESLSIGNYLPKVTSIVIPDSMTSFDKNTLTDLTGLEEVLATAGSTVYQTIGGDLYSLDGTALRKCAFVRDGTTLTLSDSVTAIGSSACYGCSVLTEVTIPSGVTSVGGHAFDACTNLATVYWDAVNCETAGSSIAPLFGGCTNLTDIQIGEFVETIPAYAFSACTAVEEITVPENVSSVGEGAFDACTNLATVYWNAIDCETGSYEPSTFARCTNLITVCIGGRVRNISAYTFADCESLQSVDFGEEPTLQSIENYAFLNCKTLQDIAIPDSVTSISSGALSGCSSLTDLTIPFVGDARKTSSDTYQYPLGYIFGTSSYDGGRSTNQYYHGYSTSYTTNTTYYIPSSLKNVTVTDGELTYGAFYNCSLLEGVAIERGVTCISQNAFYNCGSLKIVYWNAEHVEVSNSSSIFSDSSFLDAVYIGKNAEDIPAYAFSGCTGLTRVEIAEGAALQSIGNSAFYQCTNLASIELGNATALSSVGNYAFRGCTALQSIVIPDSVTSIGSSAFYECENLASVDFGKDPTLGSISENAFYGCTLLESIVIPDSVTYIDSYAFYGCVNLTSVEFGEDPMLGSIGGYAFDACTNLASIDLGSAAALSSIGNYAFRGCAALQSLVIPDSVTSIGSGALSGCVALRSLTVPFVGTSRAVHSELYQYPLGYIFGTSSYTGGSSTTQYYYGNSTSYTTSSNYYIPHSLKNVTVTGGELTYGAFYNCSMLESVTVGENVTYIGSDAFYGCGNLMTLYWNATECLTAGSSDSPIFSGSTFLYTVYIGKNVRSIPAYAFYGCEYLSSIHYDGTVDAWQSMTRESGWDDYTGSYTVTCTNGTVTKGGDVTYFEAE